LSDEDFFYTPVAEAEEVEKKGGGLNCGQVELYVSIHYSIFLLLALTTSASSTI